MAEHIRIDEGVKRGPTSKRRSVKRRRDATGAMEGIPPDLDPRIVLEQYLDATTTSEIALQYGLKRKTLVGWLRTVMPEQWKQVQVVRALCRHEDGDEGIETAQDALSLARAREQIRSAQWTLERLDSDTFGPKQEVSVTIDHQVQVEHSLTVGASELLGRIRKGNAAVLTPVIEHQPESVDTQPID